MKQVLFIVTTIVFFSVFQSCKFRQKVSQIVHHAKIYTVDDNFRVVEAMAINDGKILETGSNDEILKKYESDNEINAAGKAIFPGFIDAHCHFTGYATDGWKCVLTGTESWQQILDTLVNYSKTAPMEWLYGRGWDQNDWVIKEFPDKEKLDSLFPGRPVFLKRLDGHAAIANQKALDIAGINTTTQIDGGDIEIKNGKLTGMLLDNAMDLVEQKIPQISDSLAIEYFSRLQQKCFADGLTGVQDCGISEHTLALLEESQAQKKLQMKVFALLSDDSTIYEKWVKKGRYKNGLIAVGGFKFYADGALGSRGACLLQPYTDKPGWYGFLLSSPDHFKRAAEILIHSNLQMCTHAIGDSGNRELLKIYADVLKDKNDKRWRIEHAQILDSADFHYFKDYSIIPSVQPTHATSDMYWAETRIGPQRMKYAYAYKTLLAQNGWQPLGTDFPVEDISPIKTFFAAVVRQDAKGFPPGGFQKDEALTRQEAIRGMTIWAAKAVFQEKEKGSLVKGKAADFIMLDTDLMQCNEQDILSTKVKAVYINGKNVWEQ
ncbi:MAG: amidohydrolase [Niastella sp.]|nr:amidohydrolase [Niastella sp.]